MRTSLVIFCVVFLFLAGCESSHTEWSPNRLIGAPSSVIEKDRQEDEKNKNIDPTDGTMVTYYDRWNPVGNNTSGVLRQTRETVVDPQTGKVSVVVKTTSDAAVLSGFVTVSGSAGVMSVNGVSGNKTNNTTTVSGASATNTNSPVTNANANAKVDPVNATSNSAVTTP